VVAWILFLVLLLSARAVQATEYSLWPQLRIAGTYDDNTNTTPTNLKGDFLSVQSPGTTLKASNVARDLYLTYQTLLLENASYSGKDRFFQDHYFNFQDNERLNPNTTLSINESFLLGNSIGGGVITNNTVPLGSQLLQSLLSNSSTMSSTFAATLVSRFSDSFSWNANINQTTFSLLSGSPESKYNFSQGVAVAGDWNVGERFTVGTGYTFTDFRFSNSSTPTSEANMLAMRLGWGAGTPFSFLAQVGPVISQTSAGSIGKAAVSSQTSVDVGFLITGAYTGRRLSLTGTFSQAPGLNNGLAGAGIAQNYVTLVQYKLSRRATIFANGGYNSTEGASNSSRVIAVTAGLSYLLNENLSLSFNYVGYSSIADGVGASALVRVPGSESVTNLFIIGVTLHPDPLRWKW
jgi:hypothetical protein